MHPLMVFPAWSARGRLSTNTCWWGVYGGVVLPTHLIRYGPGPEFQSRSVFFSTPDMPPASSQPQSWSCPPGPPPVAVLRTLCSVSLLSPQPVPQVPPFLVVPKTCWTLWAGEPMSSLRSGKPSAALPPLVSLVFSVRGAEGPREQLQ